MQELKIIRGADIFSGLKKAYECERNEKKLNESRSVLVSPNKNYNKLIELKPAVQNRILLLANL